MADSTEIQNVVFAAYNFKDDEDDYEEKYIDIDKEVNSLFIYQLLLADMYLKT